LWGSHVWCGTPSAGIRGGRENGCRGEEKYFDFLGD
jgi:hypothetical protein